jgi:transcriptional regulator with XRE-family HTH domain
MASRKDAPGAVEYTAALAERLVICRKLVEPRQVDAARRVGIDPGTWFRYERGTRMVDAHTLARFCIQYDICPRFLLLGDPSGLRWPLSGNLRLIPEAVKYLPAEPPSAAPVASHENTPLSVTRTAHNQLLSRQR